MMKTPVKFQKDRSKTVEAALTRYLLQTQNHASWKAKYHVHSLFFEKAGDKNNVCKSIVMHNRGI